MLPVGGIFQSLLLHFRRIFPDNIAGPGVNELECVRESFESRGLPKLISYPVEWKYTLFVHDNDEKDSCTRSQAEKWVSSGSSEWWNEDHSRVTHPDWHSASWLNAQELEQVQEAYAAIKMADASWYQHDKEVPDNAVIIGTDRGYYVEVGERKPLGKNTELEAVIAAMKALDGDRPGRSRLVFWFDN